MDSKNEYQIGEEPVEFLVDNVSLLPKGRVLDIAMGEGRNALFLAENGFMVDGIERSEEAIKTAFLRAEKRMLHLNIIKADLEKFEFNPDENSYDIIICFYYLQRTLFPFIKKWLKKNGIIVYQTFTIDNLKYQNRPKNPDHVLQHNELLKAFLDFRINFYRECVLNNETAVASLIAEKI